MKRQIDKGDGSVGKAAHAKLRRMTMNSDALAAGQDELRLQANSTRDSSKLGHADLTHSHSHLAGSVASRKKR